MSQDSSEVQGYQTEFNEICREIQVQAQILDNSQDRILLIAWLKKLRSLQEPQWSSLHPETRIEYARYLLVILEADKTLQNRFPFNKLPPTQNHLFKSLHETLADYFTEQKLLQTQIGPLHPIISHKSDDGRAIVAVKRSSADAGSLLCYLSVSRDKPK